MEVNDCRQIIKVDDTRSGILEGKFAGAAATVGVSRYSNYMNVNSLFHASQIPEAAMQAKHEDAKRQLTDAGADFVIDDIGQLADVVKKLSS